MGDKLRPRQLLCLLLLLRAGRTSVFMGSVEVPSQSPQTIKVPAAHYEFGANLIDSKVPNNTIKLMFFPGSMPSLAR